MLSDTIFIIAIFLLLPLALLILSKKGEVSYKWEEDALVVHTGLSRYTFPYAECTASITTESLTLRLFGIGAPRVYVGQFLLSGGRRVFALADQKNPPQALLLKKGEKLYCITPPNVKEKATRFIGKMT